MDIYKAILELQAEKKRLDRVIEALERGSEPNGTSAAGRRAWNAEARRAAAERMKKYWAQRKAESSNHNVSPPSTESD